MKCDYIKELKLMAEPEYQKFSSALIPNIESNEVLGVRIPKIRALAKKIIKDNFKEFLNLPAGKTLEERLLRGFVVGYANVDLQEKLSLIKDFLPLINSWSVCDSFVVTLKFIKENKKEFWEFIYPYFKSDKPYYVRFAVVTALSYYVDSEYMKEVLENMIINIKSDDYYVKMASAWAVTEFYAKYPDETLVYLKENSFSEDIHNMAIKKISESTKIASYNKEKAKKLKR